MELTSMRNVTLLAEWGGFAIDDVLEVDDQTAKELIDAKTAIPFAAKRDGSSAPPDPLANLSIEELVAAAQRIADVDGKKISIKPALDIADDPKGGFETFNEFARDVFRANNTVSEKLRKWVNAGNEKTTGYLEENQDSMGGFTVPTEFSANLLQKSWGQGKLLSRATSITMSSNKLEIPAVAESSRVDGSRQGGIRGYWTDELGQLTVSNPTFEQVELKPKKLTCFCHVSSELLEDSAFDMGTFLTNGFANEITFKLEDGIYRGNGVAKPLGVLNAGATITVARSSAAHIDWLDIRNMYLRLYEGSEANAVWLCNRDCLGKIFGLADAGSNAIYIANGNIVQQVPRQLYGFPLLTCEFCSTLGTEGDLALVDLTQYLLARRGTIRTEMSIHFKFDYDLSSFRAIVRVDGQPWWSSAVTPYQGSNTQSPFVVLTDAS